MFTYTNLNNQYNNFYSLDNIKSYGKYPYLKAYIKSYNASVTNQFDTDVSNEAMMFFKKHYDFLSEGVIENKYDYYNKNNHKKQIKLNDDTYVIFGDTLNSMKHIFNFFLTEYCKKIPDDITISNKTIKNKKWTNADYKILEDNFDIIFSDDNIVKTDYANTILEQFNIFASLSDTIGNIFPCPPQFNGERSNFGKNDFVDILLWSIYKYLSELKEDYLDMLFVGVQDIKRNNGSVYTKREHISNSKKRLQYFLQKYYNNSWDNFVHKNHFEYAINIKNGICKEPKPLWNGHSISNSDYPEIGEEFIKMLSNIIIGMIIRNESFQ